MEITAKTRYLRISPRKTRAVADLLRGMDVERARASLKFSPRGAAGPLLKLLDSAIANAKNNFSIQKGLFIKKIFVDQGPTQKRSRPAARGVTHPINKKTSHITIILDKKNES